MFGIAPASHPRSSATARTSTNEAPHLQLFCGGRAAVLPHDSAFTGIGPWSASGGVGLCRCANVGANVLFACDASEATSAIRLASSPLGRQGTRRYHRGGRSRCNSDQEVPMVTRRRGVCLILDVCSMRGLACCSVQVVHFGKHPGEPRFSLGLGPESAHSSRAIPAER